MTRWYLIFILMVSCFASHSQVLPPKQIDSAVKEIAKLIDSNYVFSDRGKVIARDLLDRHKKRAFKEAKDWRHFSFLLSDHFKNTSRDGHLYVRFDPRRVAVLRSGKSADQSSEIAEQRSIANNYGFKETKILEGNIGYLKLSEINITNKSLPILFASIQFIANTKALIIDLQNNGGGGSDVGPVFESIFLPKNTTLLEFKTRDGKSSVDKSLEWVPSTYSKPVYILVNGGTASAAEYLAFVMKIRGRAKVIGQKSAGGAHMNSWFPVNDSIFVSVSTAAPTIPGTNETWEQKGVPLDFEVDKGQEIDTVMRLEQK